MKKLSSLTCVLLCVLLFSACSKEKPIKYDLTIIAPEFENLYNYYSPAQTEENRFVLAEDSTFSEQLTPTALKDILSVTICDTDISPDNSKAIIALCKPLGIPVFFMFEDIDREILSSYDKSFCISADYTYIGEKFAAAIHSMWKDGLIVDRNKNLIFSFSVIKPETLTQTQQNFYDSLIRNIELLGVPIELLEEVSLNSETFLPYCKDNRKANESFILVDNSFLPLAKEGYEAYGEGVEILSLDYGTKNTYLETPSIKVCFIDYLEYFKARETVLTNIKNKAYPFEGLAYSVTDKSIFIEPTI